MSYSQVVDQTSVSFLATIGLPKQPSDFNIPLQDASVIIEIMTENALFVKEAPSGDLSYDTIYSHMNSTHMLIRTESEWNKQFGLEVRMKLLALRSVDTQRKVIMKVKVQVDYPTAYEDTSVWHSREYVI
jgi:hypothetical protein